MSEMGTLHRHQSMLHSCSMELGGGTSKMADTNERIRQHARTRVSAEIKASGLQSLEGAYVDGRKFDLVAGEPQTPGRRFFVEILLQTNKYRETTLLSDAGSPDPTYAVLVDCDSGQVDVPRALREHIKNMSESRNTPEVR
jgi:hypothetical protein